MLRYVFLIVIISTIVISSVTAQGYILKKGDTVDILVWEEEDLKQEVTIGEDGTISFPLIGEVEAEGLTPQQLDDRITELLRKDYLVNPDVTVSMTKQQFFITGEVKRPGAHPLIGNIGPLQAVTVAGGFTDFASSTVRIIRQVEGKEKIIRVNVNAMADKEGNINEEYTIKPNDVIIVPRSFF